MSRFWKRAVGLAGAVSVATAATLIVPAAAHAAEQRIEAESGAYGGVCGDGQLMVNNGGWVFFGGEGCRDTFTLNQQVVVKSVVYHGGGTNGTICGYFTIESGSAEISRTANQCGPTRRPSRRPPRGS